MIESSKFQVIKRLWQQSFQNTNHPRIRSNKGLTLEASASYNLPHGDQFPFYNSFPKSDVSQ